MRFRSLLIGGVLLAACFKPGGSGGAKAPPSNQATVTAVDYSATIADPVGFLPIDSEVVLSLDAEQLRRSPVWPMLNNWLLTAAGSDLQMFQTACGFDPVTSIRGLTLGIKNLEQETPDGVLVVTGFDRKTLTACMTKAVQFDPKAAKITADGTILIPPDSPNDSPVIFKFVDASTVVAMIGPATSAELFRQTLARGSPLRGSPAFVELFGRVRVDTALWGVINGNSSVFEEAAALGMKPKAIVGSISLANGLDADMRIRLATPAEAQQITTMAQGQLQAATGFFDKLEVTADAQDVAVVALMNDQQVQTMIAMVARMIGTTTP